MGERLGFIFNRLKERLWIRPMVVCVLSIIGALLASMADGSELYKVVPDITKESLENLLNIMAASMLVIATFAVSSMVSAYASTGNTATPRAFSLLVSDDVSKNALSTFIGAFIYSIVALMALKNGYYGQSGRFTLFALTLLTLSVVVITFVYWVDRIARLGRLGMTVDKVEKAATKSLKRRRETPSLRGVRIPAVQDARLHPRSASAKPVFSPVIGYVNWIDMATLQTCAEEMALTVEVAIQPGEFSAPGKPIAYITLDDDKEKEVDTGFVVKAFTISDDRVFDDDPRFGFVVLGEIAGTVLSPSASDPGTAIDIMETLLRLFILWVEPLQEGEVDEVAYDRILVPELSLHAMFEEAFTPIARDGAGLVEVTVRLLHIFEAMTLYGHPQLKTLAIDHARLALARAEIRLQLEHDKDLVRNAARFACEPEPESAPA